MKHIKTISIQIPQKAIAPPPSKKCTKKDKGCTT